MSRFLLDAPPRRFTDIEDDVFIRTGVTKDGAWQGYYERDGKAMETTFDRGFVETFFKNTGVA